MSPELAAIAGALGGALIAVLGAVYIALRKERREAKVAARLLLAELGETRGSVAFAIDENDWACLASQPPELPSWDLASRALAIKSRTWRKANAAHQAVKMIADRATAIDGPQRIYPDIDPEAPGDSDRTELTQALQDIEEAILALSKSGRFRDEAEFIELDRDLAEKYP